MPDASGLILSIMHLPSGTSFPYRKTVTNKTQETNSTLGLLAYNSQGKAIGYAQFMGRYFYKKIFKGCSIFQTWKPVAALLCRLVHCMLS